MQPSQIDRLLDPAPLPLEMGYERLPDGVLHIACRTDLHRCRGEMLEWWFRFRPTTQHYVWWHPLDHLSSSWEGELGPTHIGSIHRVEESFAGSPPRKLLIQFRDPAEFFDAKAVESARAQGAVSAILCGRGGESWSAPRDPQGRILGSRLFHICRDTEWGSVLRSHFFLGCDLHAAGRSPIELQAMIPDAVAPALLTHCYSEFTYLSRFLPSLFAAENREVRAVALPW
jgi:hypothetical protein